MMQRPDEGVGSFFHTDYAKKYESSFKKETLYKTRKGAWVLHTAGDETGELAKWAVIPIDVAYEWLIENDHADVIPADDLAQLEI